MKTARAKVLVFTMACPYCETGYLVDWSGSTMFSINESHPPWAQCVECGLFAKIPARCFGDQVDRVMTPATQPEASAKALPSSGETSGQ